MIELTKNTYWEIEFELIEKLVLEHFSIQLDLPEDMGFHHSTYYVVGEISKDPEQNLDKEIIEYCLLSKEARIERLEQAVWCLIMKDILPEGRYLVSVCW